MPHGQLNKSPPRFANTDDTMAKALAPASRHQRVDACHAYWNALGIRPFHAMLITSDAHQCYFNDTTSFTAQRLRCSQKILAADKPPMYVISMHSSAWVTSSIFRWHNKWSPLKAPPGLYASIKQMPPGIAGPKRGWYWCIFRPRQSGIACLNIIYRRRL